MSILVELLEDNFIASCDFEGCKNNATSICQKVDEGLIIDYLWLCPPHKELFIKENSKILK